MTRYPGRVSHGYSSRHQETSCLPIALAWFKKEARQKDNRRLRPSRNLRGRWLDRNTPPTTKVVDGLGDGNQIDGHGSYPGRISSSPLSVTCILENDIGAVMFDGRPKQLQNKNQAPPAQVCQVCAPLWSSARCSEWLIASQPSRRNATARATTRINARRNKSIDQGQAGHSSWPRVLSLRTS